MAKVTYGLIFGSFVLYQLKKGLTRIGSDGIEESEGQESLPEGSPNSNDGIKTTTTSDKDMECECKCKSATLTSYDLERFHFYP